MPPFISRTVNEYLSGPGNDKTRLLYDFLYSLRVNLGSPEIVSDYVEAINLAAGENNSAISENPLELSIIFDYFENENNADGLFFGIIKAYPSDDRENIIKSLDGINGLNNIPDKIHAEYSNFNSLIKPEISGKLIAVEDKKFIGFSSGTYLSGLSLPDKPELLLNDKYLNAFPHPETVKDFFILEKEVTRKDFSLFLNENPKWRLDNIDKLMLDNLVIADYLNSQDFTDTGKPIANISWYAATAYCQWLETKLPDNMLDYTIKLPSEAQWESAARLNAADTVNIFKESGASSARSADFTRIGKAGLYDIRGNLWEWMDNWYFPTDSVNGSFGLTGSAYNGVEKAVRGGSWANPEDEIDISTRGSQNPAWCTPFLGFRPVLVKNNGK